jgi:hypothetical protein
LASKRRIAFVVERAKVTRMTTLICSIPKKLDARLKRLARQAKVPKDKFVRNALERAARRPCADGAAFTLVSDLCGSLSGPSDLATHPKYLEGLGA